MSCIMLHYSCRESPGINDFGDELKHDASNLQNSLLIVFLEKNIYISDFSEKE